MLAALLTAPAPPLSAAGDISIRGKVLGQGAPCVQFRLSGGETVSLQGASPQQFKKGMAMRVSGRWISVSNCMQGRTFQVKEFSKI